ncbi:MAG: AIPR family protein [Desulfobulbia bacterium]
MDGEANAELNSALIREKVKEKLESGYSIEGVFCCNVCLNKDGEDYIKTCSDLNIYDANHICKEHIDLDAKSGIDDTFTFDVSDTEIIKYLTAEGVKARIFLANALQLLHMTGISDGTLFSQNVRFSLGNTKVNKSLTGSIRDKAEHKNFPLYHNGITVLCSTIKTDTDTELSIKNYVVVNGAQSLTSLMNAKSSITQELRVLVKVVELSEGAELSDKITQNSNNQNAIKARDLKSNDPIQERLKKEIAQLNYSDFVLEVKRGETNTGKKPISNEDAGLVLLSMNLGESWSCHQKFKVMDESHAKIFGRSDVDGAKIIALYEALQSVIPSLEGFDDTLFGHYTLTRYFLAYAVAEIIKSDPAGQKLFLSFNTIIKKNKLDDFKKIFALLASTTVDDINAEIAEIVEKGNFDYKRDLKSPNWCRTICGKLKSAYSKDVKRKKADPIKELVAPILT